MASMNNSLLMEEGFGKKESQNIFFKWIKKFGPRIGLITVDPCCTQDPDNRPVRYNITLTRLEYLDATQTWVPA
jgi:hypothetical protein